MFLVIDFSLTVTQSAILNSRVYAFSTVHFHFHALFPLIQLRCSLIRYSYNQCTLKETRFPPEILTYMLISQLGKEKN